METLQERTVDSATPVASAVEPLTVIYTSGRVGSTTLFGTLKRHLGDDKVWKVHRLTAEGIAEYERFRPIWTDDKKVFAMLESNEDHRLKLISSTRDPFASEVSSLFHNLEVHFPDQDPQSFDLEMLRDRVINNKSSSSKSYFTSWFDIEFAPFTGIEIYAQPFPIDKGYQIYSKGRVEVLVFRLEDLDRVFAPALDEFLGLDVDQLELHHIGEKQPYADIYKRFKKEVRFPKALLDTYYETQYCRHFYTPAEIAGFRDRWQAAE